MREYFSNLIQTDEDRREYHREMVFLQVAELICKLMEEKGINRSDLASRLGISKSAITQILNGGRNLTLGKICDIFLALGEELKISSWDKSCPMKLETIPYMVEYSRGYNVGPINSHLKIAG